MNRPRAFTGLFAGLFSGIGTRPGGGAASAGTPGAPVSSAVDAVRLRADAEALSARLPALLAEAEQVAATVAQGVHGRRRAGSGDSFWQYRQLMPGESITRIDWRQSARSTRAYVRETEWEAAQTVCLWRDASASMDWRSSGRLPTKRQRAELLLLGLGILLLRGGEHLRLLDTDPSRGDRARSMFSGRQAAERLAVRLLQQRPQDSADLPAGIDMPRHARLVLIGDFLEPLAAIEAALGRFAALPVSVQLVQVLDPAELSLPYSGRVRFEGTEGEATQTMTRVEDVQDGYRAALAAHQAGLATLCAGVGCGLLSHRTDQPPQTALLALHQALAHRGPTYGASAETFPVTA